MPRRARLSLKGVAHHVIQRGNHRSACFLRRGRLSTLPEMADGYAVLCDCRIHAYVLMTNHVHLLLTPDRANGVSDLMKRLGQCYVQ